MQRTSVQDVDGGVPLHSLSWSEDLDVSSGPDNGSLATDDVLAHTVSKAA